MITHTIYEDGNRKQIEIEIADKEVDRSDMWDTSEEVFD